MTDSELVCVCDQNHLNIVHTGDCFESFIYLNVFCDSNLNSLGTIYSVTWNGKGTSVTALNSIIISYVDDVCLHSMSVSMSIVNLFSV